MILRAFGIFGAVFPTDAAVTPAPTRRARICQGAQNDHTTMTSTLRLEPQPPVQGAAPRLAVSTRTRATLK